MKRLNKQIMQSPSRFFDSGHFITDGNLEAALIAQNVEMNHSAAFELLYTREGRQVLNAYHAPYLDLAEEFSQTYIIQTPTWRANPDWIFKLGYPPAELNAVNRHAVQFVREIQHAGNSNNMLISGCVGPRNNEYNIGSLMSSDAAAKYHTQQVLTFALSDVDFISGMGINYSAEAVGIIRAAQTVGVPVVISFPIKEDGCLASGEVLSDVISLVDKETDCYAQHFNIQCSGPAILHLFVNHLSTWRDRVHGITIDLDVDMKSNPESMLKRNKVLKLTEHFSDIRRSLPNLKVIGGLYDGHGDLIHEVCRQILHFSVK